MFDLDLVNDLLFLQRFQEIFYSSTFGSFFLFFFGLSLPLEHVIPIVGDMRLVWLLFRCHFIIH
jgi:hypothetical protein